MDADWRDHPEDLCYDGESVEAAVDADAGRSRVVVTTHRVLAFAPDHDPRFREVARPNVTGVAVEAVGATGPLHRAARFGAWGVGLLAAGLLVPLDAALAGTGDLGGANAGGALSFLGTLLAALALLDDPLRVVGAVLLLVAAALAALHVWSRQQTAVVQVSGHDDVEVFGGETTAAALRDALESE